MGALSEVQEIKEVAIVQVENSAENELKKSKKSKSKIKSPESVTCSSADETKEVEVKSKKKKNKNKDKEREDKEKSPEPVVFRPFIKEKTPEPVKVCNFEKEKSPEPKKSSKKAKTPKVNDQDMSEVKTTEDKDDDILVVEMDEKFEEVDQLKPNTKYGAFPEEDSNDIFEEFSKEEASRIIEIDDNDDSEKFDFFIREKSSSF